MLAIISNVFQVDSWDKKHAFCCLCSDFVIKKRQNKIDFFMKNLRCIFGVDIDNEENTYVPQVCNEDIRQMYTIEKKAFK